MKSLEELRAMREKMRTEMNLRRNADGKIRVVVGMATCGIAAGARPVMTALLEQVAQENLSDSVAVTQTGCVGMCQLEPIVEVFEPGKEKTTYVKMTPDKVARIVKEHLKNGAPVMEFTAGAAK